MTDSTMNGSTEAIDDGKLCDSCRSAPCACSGAESKLESVSTVSMNSENPVNPKKSSAVGNGIIGVPKVVKPKKMLSDKPLPMMRKSPRSSAPPAKHVPGQAVNNEGKKMNKTGAAATAKNDGKKKKTGAAATVKTIKKKEPTGKGTKRKALDPALDPDMQVIVDSIKASTDELLGKIDGLIGSVDDICVRVAALEEQRENQERGERMAAKKEASKADEMTTASRVEKKKKKKKIGKHENKLLADVGDAKYFHFSSSADDIIAFLNKKKEEGGLRHETISAMQTLMKDERKARVARHWRAVADPEHRDYFPVCMTAFDAAFEKKPAVAASAANTEEEKGDTAGKDDNSMPATKKNRVSFE